MGGRENEKKDMKVRRRKEGIYIGRRRKEKHERKEKRKM